MHESIEHWEQVTNVCSKITIIHGFTLEYIEAKESQI